MDYFSATDFEPATGYGNNICQVGKVRVESGIITQEINLLFQPPNNYYLNRFTDIHGIAAKDTLNSLAFAPVWQQIIPYIENQNVIEHNGFGVYFLFWIRHFYITVYRLQSTINFALIRFIGQIRLTCAKNLTYR